MYIIDTQIPSNTDKTVLKAFFHGHIHGEYKIYNDDDNKTLSVKFDSDEDASVFKLKELDKVYVDTFHRLDSKESTIEKAMREMGLPNNPPFTTQPYQPWVNDPFNRDYYGKIGSGTASPTWTSTTITNTVDKDTTSGIISNTMV